MYDGGHAELSVSFTANKSRDVCMIRALQDLTPGNFALGIILNDRIEEHQTKFDELAEAERRHSTQLSTALSPEMLCGERRTFSLQRDWEARHPIHKGRQTHHREVV